MQLRQWAENKTSSGISRASRSLLSEALAVQKIALDDALPADMADAWTMIRAQAI